MHFPPPANDAKVGRVPADRQGKWRTAMVDSRMRAERGGDGSSPSDFVVAKKFGDEAVPAAVPAPFLNSALRRPALVA
jgi:hypothetical protein